MSTPYDLLEVSIKGEVVAARPTAWDRDPENIRGEDAAGEMMVPIQYMVTCPHCAGLVEFKPDNLFVGATAYAEAGTKSLKCPTCEASDEIVQAALMPIKAPVDPETSIVVTRDPKIQTEAKVKVVEKPVDPFVDPIENELIDTANFRL